MFAIYADAEALRKQRVLSAGVVVLIIGPNWTVNIDDEAQRAKVAAALGGDVDGGAGGPRPKPSTESKPEEPGIGDPVRDDDYKFTVTKIRCGVSRVGSTYWGDKAQGQFCLVSMKIKNVGKEPIEYSEENQALFSTKGKEYSPDDEAWASLEDNSPWGEINPGNTLKTTVPFDISKRAKPDYLLLKAGVWGFSDGVKVSLR